MFVCFYHQGRTALEAAIQTLNIDKADDELSTGRQQVVKLLRNHKATKISSELRRRNVVFDDDDNDEEADESSQESTSALQRFNDKLMKKEIERLQRMNKKILDNSNQGHVDEPHPPKTLSKGAVISEDDDSQENQLEVVLSYPSSSSGEPAHSSVHHVVGSANDMFSCDSDEASFDAVHNNGIDVGDDDSTYASMDEENGVEMVDLNDQNSDFGLSALITDPIIGTSSDTSSHYTGSVASHISQKTADWLVDDVGPRRAKRKRQAKLTNLARSTDRTRQTATASRPRHRLSLGNTHKGPHPKQSRLVVSQEPKAPESPSNTMLSRDNYVTNHWSQNDLLTSIPSGSEVTSTVLGVRTSVYDSPGASSRHTGTPGGTPPMRLKVWVQDKMFLIPCPQGNTQEAKSVGWLAEQVCFALSLLSLHL